MKNILFVAALSLTSFMVHAEPLAGDAERGRLAFGSCRSCHYPEKIVGHHNGPNLHGIFGRRIASAPGYAYSEAFRTMNIVWTKETVAKLFEIGPNAYTPGTKMPVQTIGNDAEREELIRWLEKVTAPR